MTAFAISDQKVLKHSVVGMLFDIVRAHYFHFYIFFLKLQKTECLGGSSKTVILTLK